MLEDVGPDLAKALVTGLFAGGASVAVQLLSPRAAKALRCLRLNRAGKVANEQRVERRLAAILAADVAGYSRLMIADEEGTHFRLLNHRREVIEPKVREHRGRIVKHTGDGALAEFASVVDAVRCALEVQQLMLARNAAVSQSRRIGVNLGDVIVAPDDIYGHHVNLAARLESLAAPGGICISADAWRHVRGVIAAEFVDLGEQRLKNIADPAHVFAVSPAA